ncbi:hypothetical protein BJV74DRAFT_860351 [Russula compacta]|nr:hypothetical protein BJV74DRAFT_860351 [Russula compacta]
MLACHLVSLLVNNITQCLFPSIPTSLIPGELSSKGPGTGECSTHREEESGQDRTRCQASSIDILPEDILLEVFYFYREEMNDMFFTTEMWKPLVDVCGRWRQVVFASPRRLDLLLFCDVRTPVRKSLHIWPLLPITVHYSPKDEDDHAERVENVIAALEHRDRIFRIDFDGLSASILERLAAAMQEPHPALTHLCLLPYDTTAPVLPAAFLGGSAPALQSLILDGITYLALPKLILSARNLVLLHLGDIPNPAWQISLEEMVTYLCALPKLEDLSLGFRYSRSHPHEGNSPPPARAVLPALTIFAFAGDFEYLEDLIAQIDTPLLKWLSIMFFNRLSFNIPHLHEFIGRTDKLGPLDRAFVEFYRSSVKVTLGSLAHLELGIRHDRHDPIVWPILPPLLMMAQLCNGLSSLLASVETLEIRGDWEVSMPPMQFQGLFNPFVAVQSLYVSRELVPFVILALQELAGESATEVLPALRSLFLAGPTPSRSAQKGIEPFVTARQLSDHPVAVQYWGGVW